MPSVEKHVKYCVKAFGKENEALCYQINSWMDAPSRTMGQRHRVVRHHLQSTILTAIHEFLSKEELEDFFSKKEATLFHTPNIVNGKLEWLDEEKYKQRAGLIANIVIQHLVLDGLLTQRDYDRFQREGIRIDADSLTMEQKRVVTKTQSSGILTFLSLYFVSFVIAFIINIAYWSGVPTLSWMPPYWRWLDILVYSFLIGSVIFGLLAFILVILHAFMQKS